MRRLIAGVAGVAVAALPGLITLTPATAAAPAADRSADITRHSDSLSSPLVDKQQAERARAQEMVLKGEATPQGKNKVVKIAKGQYVELARESEDSILTVLGEFGDLKHNQIPEPDRAKDNTTIWTEDFSQPYYEKLLFSEEKGAISMRNFYLEQSSGEYTVNGDVTDWATAEATAASYGANTCGGIVCRNVWNFVQDSVDDWASTMSTAELNDYLAQFDVWDRYDYDGDGNFDEPDGYIDHFQSVHAGVGEETGGGALGSNAIWSHRWYNQINPIGSAGPTVDGEQVPYGGLQIGDSNYWIGDYTIEPENGGVGVFAHEFGHDLGLPDLYDTSGNTGGAENSTGFWTLMSSGSYGNSGEPEDGIGTEPMHMGAWEKFQLGWLDYEVVRPGEKQALTLGPAEHRTKKTQGAFVLLPDRQVTAKIGSPYAGEKYYYSGSGNDLDHTMTTKVTVPAGSAQLSAKVQYQIEKDWDYAYLTVNGDEVATNRSTSSDPNGQNFGNGITGTTGGAWVDLTADLSAYAGQEVTLGFRYWTDGAAVEPGFSADEITLGGTTIGDAESDEGWTFDGFRTTTGEESTAYFNAYVLENRQYIGFDESLKTGPYNFGFTDRPDWVEHFPYQDGLLVSYWNTQYTDNNVGDHPGKGLILPVDAHPTLETWADGTLMRPRIQSYDSTFGLEATDAVTLHNAGVESTIASKKATSVFDDTKSWWTGGSAPGRYQPGWVGVDVPKTGTTVKVVSQDSHGVMRVAVNR